MSDPAPVSEKEAGTAPGDVPPTTTVPETENAVVEPEKRKREYKDFGHDEVQASRTSFSTPQQARSLITRFFLPDLILRCKGGHGYGKLNPHLRDS